MWVYSPEFFGPSLGLPPPRRTGGMVLFADYDGVFHPAQVYQYRKHGPRLMNCPGHTMFEHCGLLERELEPFPDIRIVISSSWAVRYRGSIRRITSHLTPALQARVIGATYHSRMNAIEFLAMPRGWQIWDDVTRRKPTSWLALDDDAFAWPQWCRDRLILTDPMLGMSPPPVLQELRERLESMHGP